MNNNDPGDENDFVGEHYVEERKEFEHRVELANVYSRLVYLNNELYMQGMYNSNTQRMLKEQHNCLIKLHSLLGL